MPVMSEYMKDILKVVDGLISKVEGIEKPLDICEMERKTLEGKVEDLRLTVLTQTGQINNLLNIIENGQRTAKK